MNRRRRGGKRQPQSDQDRIAKEYAMYQFVTGPLLWLTFAIFFIGCLVRVVLYIKGLHWQMDRVAYHQMTSAGVRGAVRSVVSWLIPFGTRSWRDNPVFTIFFFIFHVGLVVTPIFLLAHNIILNERWGFSLPALPEGLADLMTIAVILAAVFMVLRRISMPEVRILTTPYDYLVLLIAAAPFVTGFFAYHLAPGYDTWLILHIQFLFNVIDLFALVSTNRIFHIPLGNLAIDEQRGIGVTAAIKSGMQRSQA
jgi:nitrate reductase gamma subunit